MSYCWCWAAADVGVGVGRIVDDAATVRAVGDPVVALIRVLSRGQQRWSLSRASSTGLWTIMLRC